jgi:hypothetical protein
MSADQRRSVVEGHLALIRELAAEGQLVSSGALDPSRSIVIVPPSRATVTDGPFAEAKEGLGSFYLVEASDEDAASEIATRLPESPGLHVLVVPVLDV